MNKAEDLTGTQPAPSGTAPAPLPPLPWPPDRREIREALLGAFCSGDWGRYDADCSRQLCQLIGTATGRQHVRPVSSGTIGVELALRTAGVKTGDFVAISAYDYPGNFRAIEAIGARPLLIDTEPGRWTLSPQQFRDALNRFRPAAAVCTHLHGMMSPMPELVEAAAAAGTVVVEDACQVPGAQVGGKPAGGWGDLSVLSFGGSKLLTAGNGGAVATDDARYMQRLKILVERPSDAAPLSPLQAAVLIPQLQTLACDNAHRREAAEALRGRLRTSRLFQPGRLRSADAESAYYKLGLLITDPGFRDRVIALATQLQLRVGTGFRGFLKRSRNRCAAVSELAESHRCAAGTILIDHTSLGRSAVDGVAVAERLLWIEKRLER